MLKKYLGLFFIVLFVQVANAQYGGSMYNTTINVMITNSIRSDQLRRDINRNQTLGNMNRVGRGTSKTVKPKPIIGKGVTSFKKVAYIVPDVLHQGKDQKTLQAKAITVEMLDRFEDVALKDSFPANDLAYAFNSFVVHNYIVYHHLFDPNLSKKRTKSNGKLETDDEVKARTDLMDSIKNLEVEQAMFEQFKSHLSNQEGVKKLTDKEKQMFAEMLAINAIMPISIYQNSISQNDAEGLKEARLVGKQNLEKLFGISVDKIKLSKQGLSFDD